MSTSAPIRIDLPQLLELQAKGNRLYAIARVVGLTSATVCALLCEIQHGGRSWEC